MSRSRIPGSISNQFLPPAEKRTTTAEGWKRFYLGSAAAVHPGGGATLTLNSESHGNWTDITQPAHNKKKPCTEVSAYFYTLRDPVTNNTVKWGDEWTINVHIVTNQYSDTGTSTGRGQSCAALVTNSIVCDGTDHHYLGAGTYNLDDDDIKVVRTYSSNCAGAPVFTTRQLRNSGFTQQSRHLITMENSLHVGPKLVMIEYRDYDNTVEQGGADDIDGYFYDNFGTPFACAPSDPAYLCIYFPGLNSTSSMALTNHQFKAYFKVSLRDSDPVVSLGD